MHIFCYSHLNMPRPVTRSQTSPVRSSTFPPLTASPSAHAGVHTRSKPPSSRAGTTTTSWRLCPPSERAAAQCCIYLLRVSWGTARRTSVLKYGRTSQRFGDRLKQHRAKGHYAAVEVVDVWQAVGGTAADREAEVLRVEKAVGGMASRKGLKLGRREVYLLDQAVDIYEGELVGPSHMGVLRSYLVDAMGVCV